MRRSMYFVSAVACALISVPLFWLSVSAASTNEAALVRHLSPAESLRIATAAAFVHDFLKANGKLPESSEFRSWAQSQAANVYSAEGFSYNDGPAHGYPSQFGEPPSNAFTLCDWDGSNPICVPSWYGENKLAYISSGDYFVTGSKVLDFLGFLFAGAGQAVMAARQWSRFLSRA